MTATSAALRIEELASGIGICGLSATRLRDGAHLGVREDELFATASVIKVPLLVGLYDAARAGRIDLRERVALGDGHRVAGSGVLQDLDAGLAPTIRDLGVLMITVSDNEATDILLDRVGRERVDALMASYGLESIRCPMNTREMLFDLVGMDPSRPGGYEENRQKLLIASSGPAVLPERTDRSTPRDLCRLFELLERRAILDPAACDEILDICKRQKYATILPARLPPDTVVAHKTGSLRGIRNDAGVVYATDGAYAIAIFSRELADTGLAIRALADLSLAVYEHFAS